MNTIRPVLFLLGAAAAFAQMPIFSPAFPPALKEYLTLSDAQVAAINNFNQDYNRFVAEKQRRIAQVQSEIAQETAKSPLDPMALGVRYAEIEAINREIRDRLARTREGVASTLNDAQKAKLKSLDDALKLMPLISEAQCQNLLVPAPANRVAFPGNIIPASRWFDTTTFLQTVPGYASFLLGVPYLGCGTSGGFTFTPGPVQP